MTNIDSNIKTNKNIKSARIANQGISTTLKKVNQSSLKLSESNFSAHKHSNTPLVSVIMPVYNAQKHLVEAVNSILNQSYSNLELIIINDGSTDKSEEILLTLTNTRIRYVKNKKNLGVSKTLNIGLQLARGKYVARMDADDLSMPKRIEKQVKFLEKNKDHGMIGTQYINMDKHRTLYEIGAQIQKHSEIVYAIQSMNVFCHGSVMFRNSFIKKEKIRYRTIKFEDYELWTRIVKKTKTANIPEVLYVYMNNPSGVFLQNKENMEQGSKKLGKRLQSNMELPHISMQYLKLLIKNKQAYETKSIVINGISYASNYMLAYQTFIYKLGLVFIQRKKWEGISLIILSFYLNPQNWFKKLLSII
jgi:glycosyltransferase involved in cell wall biosynthesis